MAIEVRSIVRRLFVSDALMTRKPDGLIIILTA